MILSWPTMSYLHQLHPQTQGGPITRQYNIYNKHTINPLKPRIQWLMLTEALIDKTVIVSELLDVFYLHWLALVESLYGTGPWDQTLQNKIKGTIWEPKLFTLVQTYKMWYVSVILLIVNIYRLSTRVWMLFLWQPWTQDPANSISAHVPVDCLWPRCGF